MLTRLPLTFDLSQSQGTLILLGGCPLTPEPFQIGGWGGNECPTAGLLPPPSPLSNASSSPATPTADMDFCLNADFQRINRTVQALRRSGFYYEGLSWQKAADLLRKATPGTFLVRDSADPRFLFSLSVQTDRGPTSVRLHYVQGQFRLDAEDTLVSSMPLFECVLQLVDYYVDLSRSAKGSSCVWLDGSGRRDLRVRLYQSLSRQPPTLQHAARLAVNRRTEGSAVSGLPAVLRHYLSEYPHRH